MGSRNLLACPPVCAVCGLHDLRYRLTQDSVDPRAEGRDSERKHIMISTQDRRFPSPLPFVVDATYLEFSGSP